MSTVNHFPGHHVMKQVSNSVGGYSNNSNMNYKVIPTYITLQEDGSVINLYLVYIKHLGYINMLGYIMRYNTGEECQATSLNIHMDTCFEPETNPGVQPKSAFDNEYEWYYHNFVTDDDINNIMLIEGKLYTKDMLPLYIHSFASETSTNGSDNLTYIDVKLTTQDHTAELHVFVPTYEVGRNYTRYFVTYNVNSNTIFYKSNQALKIDNSEILDIRPLNICGYVESSTDLAYALFNKASNKFELYKFDETPNYVDILQYPASVEGCGHVHDTRDNLKSCPLCGEAHCLCSCGKCLNCNNYVRLDGTVEVTEISNNFLLTKVGDTNSLATYAGTQATIETKTIKEAIPRFACCLNLEKPHFLIGGSFTTNTTLIDNDGESITLDEGSVNSFTAVGQLINEENVSEYMCPCVLIGYNVCKCGYCKYCGVWHDTRLLKKHSPGQSVWDIPNDYFDARACRFPNSDKIHRFIYDKNGTDITQYVHDNNKTRSIYIGTSGDINDIPINPIHFIVPNLSDTDLHVYIAKGLYCRCGCPLIPAEIYTDYYSSITLPSPSSYDVYAFHKINSEWTLLKDDKITVTLSKHTFIDIPAYSNNLCKQPDNIPAPGIPLLPQPA